MLLNKSDIKQIKEMKKAGIVIPLLIFFISCLVFIIPVLFIVLKGNYSWINYLSITISIILVCFIINWGINRKYNKDLKHGLKILEEGIVQHKEEKKSYEAGGGSLHIPILGSIFPKLFSQTPRVTVICYLIINNIRYEVEEELYDRVSENEKLNLFFARYSKIRLSIERKA